VGSDRAGKWLGHPHRQLRIAVLIMRARRALALSVCACGGLWLPRAAPAQAAEVVAAAPSELAVTVYRAPDRQQGSINLDNLDGFALVSETRVVRLPAGESRLRFEGVADGIEAQSAIVTGLPEAIIEKNRDARVLSPAALMAAAVGKSVELVRTDRKTGKTERALGTILSDASGVVFQTAEGVEALRCSGLPERFDFEPGEVPPARPSLSVLVRAPAAVTAQVTLSYLSRGFDWGADYSAMLSADERSIDLGAWVTLANSNGTGFPSANASVVAGRVNRENGAVEPIDLGGRILARCWPRGSTSDSSPRELRLYKEVMSRTMAMPAMAASMTGIIVTAQRKVELEQLGDLKLYRIPERTTVASRQSKQVRLLDRAAIPVTTFYRVNLSADEAESSFAAERMLRAVNDKANHLGLPLPSGSVAVFALHDGQRLLLHESALRDLAVNEKVEIGLGPSPDVQVALVHETVSVGSVQAKLLPSATLRGAARDQVERVRVTNARAVPVRIELHVALNDGARLIRADHPLSSKNGPPTFALTVPAQGSAALQYQIRYQTQTKVP
jgi:hypothetical protein